MFTHVKMSCANLEKYAGMFTIIERDSMAGDYFQPGRSKGT